VTLEQATEALRVAYQIIDCFKNRTHWNLKVKRENFKIKYTINENNSSNQTGTMGNGAHTFAQSGFTVKLIDVSENL
jgi:hypothetical protein